MGFIPVGESRYIKTEAVTMIYDKDYEGLRLIVAGAEVHVSPKFANYVRWVFELEAVTSAFDEYRNNHLSYAGTDGSALEKES